MYPINIILKIAAGQHAIVLVVYIYLVLKTLHK